MTKYLVLKRIKEDRVYLPGETLVDPSFGAILVGRGYLQIVPDNFEGKINDDEAADRAAFRKATREHARARARGQTQTEDNFEDTGPAAEGSAGSVGSAEEPTSGLLTLDDLMDLNRADLNELAIEQGVEEPDKLPNKQAVAEAILAASASADEDEDDGKDD